MSFLNKVATRPTESDYRMGDCLQCGQVYTISAYNQPPRSTQLSISAGYVNQVLASLRGVNVARSHVSGAS